MSKSNADSKYIWMDGELVPYEEARVPVLSHSLHYGCAAFEGIRAYETSGGKTAVFRLEDHMVRFVDSTRVFNYEFPYTVKDLCAASLKVIRENGFKECYVRPLAYIDDSFRGLKLPEAPKARIAIAAWTWGKYMGDDGQQKGVRIKVSTYRRADPATSMALAKLSGAYLTPVLARREASLLGFDEALLLDPQGMVAEGSGENIFMIKGGKIFTPPPGYILPGLTRDSVIEIARQLGYQVTEMPISRNQLYLADELFFTGTAVEVTPIREVDSMRIADGKPGPITTKLLQTFFKCVRGEQPQYEKWLSYV